MTNKVIDILKEVLEDQSINSDSNQSNTDSWDSIRQLMLVGEIEDAFDITLEPEEIAEMNSVNNIIKIISTKL